MSATRDQLRAAVERGRVVEADTYRPEDGEQRARVLSPWAIDGQAVLGWDHSAGGIRRLRLDRLGRMRFAAEPYREPARAPEDPRRWIAWRRPVA